MNEDKQTFNQKMDKLIAAVQSMTQEQIDACAWVMGSTWISSTGGAWNKEAIIQELQDEKHDE